jgi:hypothetical protein
MLDQQQKTRPGCEKEVVYCLVSLSALHAVRNFNYEVKKYSEMVKLVTEQPPPMG